MLNRALVLNTIQKELRNKGVIFLFVFSLIFIYLGHHLALVVKDFVDESNMSAIIANSSQTLIIFFVSFCTNLIAIILCSTIFRSDLTTNILPQILTFPLTRLTYLLSRVTGAWLLTLCYYVFTLCLGITILLFSGSIELDFFSLLTSFVFMSLSVFGTILVCSFLSLFTNKIVTLILSFVYLTLSKVSFHQFGFESVEPMAMSVGKILNIIIYYATPRVGELSYIAEQYVGGKTFAPMQIAIVLIHFIAVCVVWSFIFKFIFDKREV